MSAVRIAPTPVEHLAAEMCAAPFASAVAFCSACVRLNSGLGGGLDGPTARLWRSTERELAAAFPSLSIDQLLGFRDGIWFGQPIRRKYVRLSELLRHVARSYLVVDGAVARPRVPPWLHDGSPSAADGPAGDRRDDEARRSLRWLSFALPHDLLLAGLDNRPDGPARIELLSPLVRRRLASRGLVETHLHANAGLSGDILWIALLRRLAGPLATPNMLASPGAALDEGHGLAPLLLAAAIARFVLAAHLAQGAPLDLSRWQPAPAGLVLRPDEANRIRHVLWAFVAGQALPPASSFEDARRDYASLTGVAHLPLHGWSSVHQGDALSAYFPAQSSVDATPELHFLRAGLRRIQLNLPPGGTVPDGDFEALFWQVVRAKCLYHRHIVQRPMTPGLTFFVRHYDRFGGAADALPPVLRLHGALVTSGLGRGLRAAELRRAPPRDLNAGIALLRDLWELRGLLLAEAAGGASPALAAWRARRPCDAEDDLWEPEDPPPVARDPVEVGAVLHFVRLRGGHATEGLHHAHGLDSHADPAGPRQGYRFAEYYARQRGLALTAARLFRHFPAAVFAIRGVDVCTDELGVPTWVMAPLLRYVKEAASVAAREAERAAGRPLQRFGTTVHAGEDFVHLLGGLRRIDEAIVRFHLRRGDRLGHALALGTDPEMWAERAGRMSFSREERLFDLAWEWKAYSRFAGAVPGDRVRFLGDAIGGLTEQIFGRPAAPFEVCQFIELLYDEHALRRAGFPHGVHPGGTSPRGDTSSHRVSPEEMLHEYLTDDQAFLNGQEHVGVDPRAEGDSLRFLHDRLRDEVASLGIVVEVNPSSNLLVGHLADLTQHPMWRLRPPRPLPGVRPVSVCIGSDDPVVFATSLPEEYQLVVDALTRAELSDDEARGWAEVARRTGEDARFTVAMTDWPGTFDAIGPAEAVDQVPWPP